MILSGLQSANKFVADTLLRIAITTEPGSAIADTDLVIEAIVENMRVKHKLFTDLDKAAPRLGLRVPLTPKMFFALLQNVSDLEMFKTKIKKIQKILTLLWTFKVAMFSFITAL